LPDMTVAIGKIGVSLEDFFAVFGKTIEVGLRPIGGDWKERNRALVPMTTIILDDRRAQHACCKELYDPRKQIDIDRKWFGQLEHKGRVLEGNLPADWACCGKL